MVTESVNYSKENESKEREFIIDQTQAQMNDLDVRAERLIHSSIGIPESFIYQRAYEQKKALLLQAKKRIEKLSELYQGERSGANSTDISTNSRINRTQQVVSYKLTLPKNSLKDRASQYRPLADKESNIWNIDPALIMAIMHSESSFRPDAKSHIPAFGLMQVVPSSAGHDVNKQIRNVDAPMNSEELYIPEVNVETGTAYLSILNSKYLRGIENDESRLYCVIAAYNTGAGNVAKAFNSNHSTNIKQASRIINSMTPGEVYGHLIKNLPYDETKNYLKKVNNRIALYRQ